MTSGGLFGKVLLYIKLLLSPTYMKIPRDNPTTRANISAYPHSDKDLGVALGGVALYTPSKSLVNSTSNIENALDNWSTQTGLLEQSIKPVNGRYSISDTQALLDNYINQGRRLAETKFLGVPTGEIVARVKSSPHDVQRLNPFLSKATRGALKEKSRIQREHYYLYKNPSTSHRRLVGHHLEELGGGARLRKVLNMWEDGLGDRVVTDSMRETMRQPGTLQEILDNVRLKHGDTAHNVLHSSLTAADGDTILEQFKQHILRTKGPDKLKSILKDNPKIGSELDNILGPVIKGVSDPYFRGYTSPVIYQNRARPFLRGIKNLGRAGRLAGASMIALPALSLLGRASANRSNTLPPVFTKRSYQQDSNSSTLPTLATTGSVASGLSGLRSLRMAKDPLALAVTYGDPKGVGSGHKEPGKALVRMLRDEFSKDPELKNVPIDEITRNTRGVLQQSPRSRYSMLINTGFGTHLGPDQTGWISELNGGPLSKTRRWLEFMNPLRGRVGYDRYMSYMTDLPHSDTQWVGPFKRKAWAFNAAPGPWATAVNPLKASTLSYGPQGKLRVPQFLQGHFRGVDHVTQGYAPALNKDTVESIIRNGQNPSRANDTIRRLLGLDDEVFTRPSTFTGDSAKRFISVSGSGRGDVVASRALKLKEALSKAGLSDKYEVVALLGGRGEGSSGKALRKYLADSGIASTGYIPSELFNAVQGSSFLNWGSTGTSSSAENLMHKNIQAVPSVWKKDLKSWDEELAKLLKAKGVDYEAYSADLDSWNAGNIRYLLDTLGEDKGVLKADTADDIISLLNDAGRRSKMTNASAARVADQLDSYTRGNKEIFNSVKRRLLAVPKAHARSGRLKLLAAAMGLSGVAGWKTQEAKNRALPQTFNFNM